MKFDESGKFKIIQFTDVHYIYNDERSEVSLKQIKEVLDIEKLDLIIFTGDVIYGKPAEESYRKVLDLVSEYKIPFGVTFGNHDDEQGLTREQLFKIISSYKYSLTSKVDGINGWSNYVLPVKAQDESKDAAVLYCMDSNYYSEINGVGGYDYIKFEQIEWYRKNSIKFTEQNSGTPIQSYAFFHIPLSEYSYAVEDQNSTMIGTRMEAACSPKLNSGMFASMKEMGDIKRCICWS